MAPSKPRLLYFSTLALSPEITRSSLQGQHNITQHYTTQHNTTQEYSIIKVTLVPIQMWGGGEENTYILINMIIFGMKINDFAHIISLPNYF